MKKNHTLTFEKIEAGRYQLVEKWTDGVYGEMINVLSFVNHKGSHKWTYTYYGHIEVAKTLKEAITILRQTYTF